MRVSSWRPPLSLRSRSTPPPHATIDQSWRTGAACAGRATRDDDPWHTDTTDTTREAVTICHQCPVRADCLTDALWRGEHGIRGGLTRLERDALLRPARRRRCPVCHATLPVPLAGVQVCACCGLSWQTRPVSEQPLPAAV